MCWLLIWHFNLRETGAAIATNITYLLNMIVTDIICNCKASIKQTFAWPSMRVFNDVGAYLRVGISGALMLCFEWWAFELLAIFSGLISVEALAAEVVVINLVTFIFMIPLGISYAASALTGYFIGRKKMDLARKYAMITLVFNTMITALVVIILGTF
jgi:MATE family multidrug resistance protein